MYQASASTGTPTSPVRDPRIEPHAYEIYDEKSQGGYDQARNAIARAYKQDDDPHDIEASPAHLPPN
jgi:hypothetical protein